MKTALEFRLVVRCLPAAMVGMLMVGAACAQQSGTPAPVGGSAEAPVEAAAAVDPVAARVEQAIADYQQVPVRKDTVAQRSKMLVWVGEIDHPRATAFLREQLQAHARDSFAAAVVAAIAKVRRLDLEDDLTRLLRGEKVRAEVRRAAAGAVIALGPTPCDRVLAIAAPEGGDADAGVRAAATEALIASGDSRALRGLAPLLQQGDLKQQVAILRLCESVHGIAPVSNARIRLVKDGLLLPAAIAWRQLACEGHDRARSLTIDMLERVIDVPPPEVAAELIGGLVRVHDEGFYPVLLRYGAMKDKVVRNALRAASEPAALDADLMRWLVQNGLDAGDPAQRGAAKLLLQRAPVEVVRPLVDRIRKDLKKGRKAAVEAAAGLHELLAKDPSWPQDLAAMAALRDFESRMLGLSMLFEIASPAGIPAAQQYAADKQWELRSLVFRYLCRCRDVSSIPVLIDRYGKEEGRLEHELEQALFVHAGRRFATRKEWEKWWRENGTGFVLPHAETVASGGSSSGGQTASYYGIPLVSSRIAFLVDTSGSMNEKVGTDRQRTRLDLAKEQLTQAIDSLSNDHRVNVINFETKVHPIWKELQDLRGDNKKDLLDKVAKLKIGGGTNVFGGIEQAFGDLEVDTIYLLTDGEPSVGITDIFDIVDAVLRVNRVRQVVIHSISIGKDSELLRMLADLTGGEYRKVD